MHCEKHFIYSLVYFHNGMLIKTSYFTFFFKEVTKIELRVVKFLVQNHTAGKRKN